MAPARSIQCMRRPPSRAASGLASLGSTISAISDCESRTGRGANASSVMELFLSWSLFSGLLLQVRFQKTFRHLLNAYVLMPSEPSCPRQVEFKVAVLDGPVAPFADIPQKQDAGRNGSGAGGIR